MLDDLFNKAALTMTGQRPNEPRAHWHETIENVKLQGLVIELARALEGENDPVILN